MEIGDRLRSRPVWAAILATWSALLIAISLGLLEAAWTGPGRGAPTNTWLGVAAILTTFTIFVLLIGHAFKTFPPLWLIPGMAILEEVTHGFLGYPGWYPTIEGTILNHWSVGYLGGFNLYPYLVFPSLTILGVALSLRRRVRRPSKDAVEA